MRNILILLIILIPFSPKANPPLAEKFQPLFLNQTRVQIIIETVSPPIQSPVIKSLTPNQRHSPSPVAMPTVQTGHMAMSLFVKKSTNTK